MADPVQLTDLDVITRYSIAVRNATADRVELIHTLRDDLAWLERGQRRPRLVATEPPLQPQPSSEPAAGDAAASAPPEPPAEPEPDHAPIRRMPAKVTGRTASRKATAAKTAAKKTAAKKTAAKKTAANKGASRRTR